jgi:hypothetical protein
MKRTHSSRQLLHLFCNMINADLEGFKTSSRNIYFENGVLFSYGPHYPMARKLGVGVGQGFKEVVLINSEKSSVTTQKHKSQLWSSVKPSQWVFHVPNINEPRAEENRVHLMNGIVDSIDAVLRGLKYHDFNDVTKKIDGFNQYAEAFRLKSFKLNQDLRELLIDLSIATTIKNKTKDEEREKRQDAERKANRVRWSTEVKLWYTCENKTNISSAYFGLNYDPIRVNGTIVESPRGVSVPLNEAVTFAKALRAGQVKVGMRISEFEVESIDAEFIQIGCHKLNIKQATEAVLGSRNLSLVELEA